MLASNTGRQLGFSANSILMDQKASLEKLESAPAGTRSTIDSGTNTINTSGQTPEEAIVSSIRINDIQLGQVCQWSQQLTTTNKSRFSSVTAIISVCNISEFAIEA
ncbi:hypothetical protein CPC16_011645 [Podila verticillata]|nr:hypothetical protein CPC16_011645 [Podila verticillata]